MFSKKKKNTNSDMFNYKIINTLEIKDIKSYGINK